MNTKDRNRAPAGRTKPRSAPKKTGQHRRTAPRSAAPVKRSQDAPEVVYTQPGPFNRNRFLLHLLSVVAVVLALMFGMSIFFTVKNVQVSGMEKYTAWEIREASGIQDGENLLAISEARVSSLIEANLPYVAKVRVGIELPDTVHIEIDELDVVYSVEAEDGSWWLIRSDGRIVDQTNGAEADRHTKVLGVKLTQPSIGEQAVASEPIPDETTADGETTPVTVKGSERLSTVISVLGYLESNGMIGRAASVSVENMTDLQIWYEDRFQVQLGDTTQLSYKISAMKAAISQMGEYQSGILDVSFTIDTGKPEKDVIYTPFS